MPPHPTHATAAGPMCSVCGPAAGLTLQSHTGSFISVSPAPSTGLGIGSVNTCVCGVKTQELSLLCRYLSQPLPAGVLRSPHSHVKYPTRAVGSPLHPVGNKSAVALIRSRVISVFHYLSPLAFFSTPSLSSSYEVGSRS